jgi:hypothetical protein
MSEEKFAYEKLEELNAAVADWAKRLQGAIRASAVGAVSQNRRLSRSIVTRVRKRQGEAYNVGLKIAKEGIYIHEGASRGYGGNVGSKWKDGYENVKHTNPQSLGKAGSGNRPAQEFVNGVIDSMLPELNDIAVRYFEDGHIRPNNLSIRLQM